MALALDQKIQAVIDPQMEQQIEEFMLGHFALSLNIEDTNIDLDALLDKKPNIKYQLDFLN